jgi:hypothetical protein
MGHDPTFRFGSGRLLRPQKNLLRSGSSTQDAHRNRRASRGSGVVWEQRLTKIQRTRIESQSLGSRLSGLSILGFGASWKPPEPERDVVRSILTALEDKRVLNEDYDFEIKDHVRQSLINIRAVLTDGIARISDKSPAAQAFRVMRAACREFLTQPHSDPLIGKAVSRLIVPPPGDPSPIVEEPIKSNEDNFFAALGKLRGIFGQQLADIAYLYRVDLEEQLASILPPEPKSDD